MSTKRFMAAMAAVLVVVLAPALLTSSHSTQAGWREELVVTIADARSDTFGLETAGTTNTVDHGQAAPADVANEPAMTVQNLSQTHTSWIDVVSARATVPASNTTSTLLGNVRLNYDPTTTGCLAGAAGVPYWAVNGGNALASGTEYPRASAKVAGDVLAPGQTKSVCPLVERTGTTAEFLLAHAGRQLDIQTKVRQRSEAPGTWSSTTATLTSRYQVKLPPATRPSADNVVCARTLLLGARSSIGLYGRLYWAWPFAGGSASVPTAAVNRFTVIRSTDGTTWAPLRRSTDQTTGAIDQYAGTARMSDDINSSWLAANASTPVYLSVRAYPYAGSSVYVDADWMVQVSEGNAQLDDYFTCRTGGAATSTSAGVANAGSVPVGLG
ncbi:hypothetical protein [Nocardioides sp. CF8]|uniref:hypothetical protein n=1 Tax=Nocardioides sp. CF8 TaxID=110319 RepID=UPI0003FF6616|nr:hypothetical protein [Nocardioides sp. CF8]